MENNFFDFSNISQKLNEIKYKADVSRHQIKTKNDLALQYETVQTYVEILRDLINEKFRYTTVKEVFDELEEATDYLEEVLFGLDYQSVKVSYNDIADLVDNIIDLTDKNTRDINVIDEIKRTQEYLKKSTEKIRNLKDFEHVLNDIPVIVRTSKRNNNTIQEIIINDPKNPLPENSLSIYEKGNYIIKYDSKIISDPSDVFLDFYIKTTKNDVDKITKFNTDDIVKQVDEQGKNQLYIRYNSTNWRQYNPSINDRGFINDQSIVTNKLINENSISYYNLPNKFAFLRKSLTNKDLKRFEKIKSSTNIEDRLINLNRIDIPDNELIKQITGLPQVHTPEQFKMGIYESDRIKINFEPTNLITKISSNNKKNPKYRFLGLTGNLRININDKYVFERLKNNKYITQNYQLEDNENSTGRLIINNFKLSNQDVNVTERVMESSRKGIVSPITEGSISKLSNAFNRLGIRGNKPLWGQNQSGLFFDIETVDNKNLSIGFAHYLNPKSDQNFKISILNENLSQDILSSVSRTRSLDEYNSISGIIQAMKNNKLTSIEFDGIHYYLQDLESSESIDKVFKQIKKDINVDFFKPNIQDFISGYNIKNFDLPILQQKLGESKAISNLLKLPVVDIYEDIPGLLQRKGIYLGSYNQENVQKALGVKINKLHVDIDDAITTAEIAKKISNLKPYRFGESIRKFIVDTGLTEDIINTDISQTGVKTNFYGSKYFKDKYGRDEIHYSDLVEEFLIRDFKPNMFGRNYNVVRNKNNDFYTEYKGKNFINVQKDYAGYLNLFENYMPSNKLFAVNTILKKQNELGYIKQKEFYKTKMNLIEKYNLNQKHEPLTMLLNIPIEEFKRNDYIPTYEIKINIGKIFKSIKNNVIERFINEDREDLIEKFFNKSGTINISIDEFREFIEALNVEKDLLIKNIKNEFEKNIDLEKYNKKSYLKALNKKINLLEKINFEETIEIQTDKNIIMNQKEFIENIQEDKNLIIDEETLQENLIESGKQKVEIQHMIPQNVTNDFEKAFRNNLEKFRKQLTIIIRKGNTREIKKDKIYEYSKELIKKISNITKFDINSINELLNSNEIKEILELNSIIKTSLKDMKTSKGIENQDNEFRNYTKIDLYLENLKETINELKDIAKGLKTNDQFTTSDIKSYNFNQALNLIDSIKDEKLRTTTKLSFNEFLYNHIQGLYDTNQQKLMSTFMNNVQQFIINDFTYNSLNNFNNDFDPDKQISKQIYDLKYLNNNELIQLDQNSLSNHRLLKLYIDVQKGNDFKQFYKQQLEQIEEQKGVVEFEFNEQKFKINQSKQPKDPVERLKWFVKNYESQSNYRYGRNTLNNYMLSRIFYGKEIFDQRNLELIDFISNIKSIPPDVIVSKIGEFHKNGLLKYNPLISTATGKKYPTHAFQNKNYNALVSDILEQFNQKYYDLQNDELLILRDASSPNSFYSLNDPNKRREGEELLDEIIDTNAENPELLLLSIKEYYSNDIRKGFLKEIRRNGELIDNKDISNYKLNELIFSHFYKQSENPVYLRLQTLNEIFHKPDNKDYTKFMNKTNSRENLTFKFKDIIDDLTNQKAKKIKVNPITDFFGSKKFIDKFQEFSIQKHHFSKLDGYFVTNNLLINFIDENTEELFSDLDIEFKQYFTILNKYKDLLYEFLDKNKIYTNEIISNEIARKAQYYSQQNPNVSRKFNRLAFRELKELDPSKYKELINKAEKDFDITKYIKNIMLNYKIGDTIDINGKLYKIVDINPITGVKVKREGKVYTLVNDKLVSAEGNFEDVIIDEASKGEWKNIELKPYRENLELFKQKTKNEVDLYKFNIVAKEQIRFYKRDKGYIDLFIEHKEDIQKQIGLDLQKDTDKLFMDNLIEFLQKHKELSKNYTLSNEQIDNFLRDDFAKIDIPPELTEFLKSNNLQKVRGYVKKDATLNITDGYVKISEEGLEKSDLAVIKKFKDQLAVFKNTDDIFKGGKTTEDYLAKLNEIKSLKVNDALETKIIIGNLDNYVENLRKVFEINDKRLNELFKLYDLQSTNKQKLYLVNQIEHNIALNKNSLIWNLIGQENFNKIRDFIDDSSGNSYNTIRYYYQLLKQKNSSELNDELLSFIQQIMAGSNQQRNLTTILSSYRKDVPIEQIYKVPIIQNVFGKQTNKKVSDKELEDTINNLIKFNLEKQEEVVDKTQTEEILKKTNYKKINFKKINYKKIAGWGQGIGTVGLIALGTIQKRKQEKKQQSVYPQQVQTNEDYYLYQELPNTEYGFDIRQLEKMPDQAVEELIYQLSDLKKDQLVNLYKTYQY